MRQINPFTGTIPASVSWSSCSVFFVYKTSRIGMTRSIFDQRMAMRIHFYNTKKTMHYPLLSVLSEAAAGHSGGPKNLSNLKTNTTATTS